MLEWGNFNNVLSVQILDTTGTLPSLEQTSTQPDFSNFKNVHDILLTKVSKMALINDFLIPIPKLCFCPLNRIPYIL